MNLLNNLSTAQWLVAAKTFGNNHATLIGLMVNWWITAASETHWVLESGPSFGYRPNGEGGGLCDALLCEGNSVLGVLEVEGTRGKYTAEKIGYFFAAELEHYTTLKFAILLLYSYSPTGKGVSRTMQPARNPETFDEVCRVSALYPEKSIVVITIDKIYERPTEGIRKRSEYYFSKPSVITGYLFQQGQEVDSRVLYDMQSRAA